MQFSRNAWFHAGVPQTPVNIIMTIQNITLGDNTYTIDTDSDTSITNALETEIKFQYRKYNFNLHTNSNGVEYPLHVSVHSRRLPQGTTVKVLEYSPQYHVIHDTKTIRCYSMDTIKSITDIINKFIQRCEESVQKNIETLDINQAFIDEVNNNFPHAKIEYSDPDRWPGQKNNAKIYFENGYIQLYHDNKLSAYITIDDDSKHNTYSTITKLLK